jgi:hypothetical protein
LNWLAGNFPEDWQNQKKRIIPQDNLTNKVLGVDTQGVETRVGNPRQQFTNGCNASLRPRRTRHLVGRDATGLKSDPKFRRDVMRVWILGVVVAVAAAISGSALADDQQIADFIKARLIQEKQQGNLFGFNVDMRVDQGTVWFKGFVFNRSQELLILRTAQLAGHLGVVQVVDDIEVTNPYDNTGAQAPQPPHRVAMQPSQYTQSPSIPSTANGYAEVHPSMMGERNWQETRPAVTSGPGQMVPQFQPMPNSAMPTTPLPVTDQRQRTMIQPGAGPLRSELPMTMPPAPRRMEIPMSSTKAPEPDANTQHVAYQEPYSGGNSMYNQQPMVSNGGYNLPTFQNSMMNSVLAQPASMSSNPVQPIAQPVSGAPLPFARAAAPQTCLDGSCGYSGVPMASADYGGSFGGTGISSDSANLPGYAWPAYASHPNYGAVSYPKQYSASAWPYIGPFYPYPQVPLGWRKVALEWDDGWWFLDFHDKN